MLAHTTKLQENSKEIYKDRMFCKGKQRSGSGRKNVYSLSLTNSMNS